MDFDHPYGPEVTEAFQRHAIDTHPHECVGVVLRDASGRFSYRRLENVHPEPAEHWRAPDEVLTMDPVAICHSHPSGPNHPSKADMEAQVACAVPFGICVSNPGAARLPFWWGFEKERRPLLDRHFKHGVTDCFSLVRDVFAAGKAELKRQGVTSVWPYRPIRLADCPRAWQWWIDDGVSLYEQNLKAWGFRRVDEPRVGDVALLRLGSPHGVPNHAGILVANDVILHHAPKEKSSRQSVYPFIQGGAVAGWVRYVGKR